MGDEMGKMIENPEVYFEKLIPKRGSLLKELEAEAERESIPIIGPVVGEFLYILARSINAVNILELGTATGYSAMFLAEAVAEKGGRVVTLENNLERGERAKKNFEKAGLDRYINVVFGDALNEISNMEDLFDMIFIDINKSDYIIGLPHFYRLLRKNGLLVADNIGFKDAEPYNKALFEDPSWRTVNLYAYLPLHSPENDGLSVALRL